MICVAMCFQHVDASLPVDLRRVSQGRMPICHRVCVPSSGGNVER